MSGDTIETIVGHVPASWPIHTLESLAVFITKGGTPTTYGHDWADASTGIPFFRSECVTDNGFAPKGMNFISPAAHQQMVRSEVKPGDLLMTITGNVGRVAKAPEEFATANINQHIARIRVLGTPDADADYVYHCLKHDGYAAYYRSIFTGQAYPQISLQQVRETPIALPPVAERRKIAAILTAVDDKLDVIARQIEATQTLKQGLMQTLFSRGVGTRSSDGTWAPHTQLHDIDGRELPRAWGAATLGEYIAELRSGVSVNAEDRVCRPGEIGVLKVSSVQGGRFLRSNHKTVVPMEIDRVAEPVQEGCIIISRANTPALVGESAYVMESCYELFLPDKLWQTRPTNKAHSTRWLAFYLQSPAVRQEVQKAATGTSGSMKNISKASLLNIFMPLVPLEEQHHIADLLGAVTSKIEALEAKHRHYHTLKRGLMQKLLTGEWRVKVDAEIAA